MAQIGELTGFIITDLIMICDAAVETVRDTAIDTGGTFKIEDVIDLVERDLPPAPSRTSEEGRRLLIIRIIDGIVHGYLYGLED